jgi:hypothetical protein
MTSSHLYSNLGRAHTTGRILPAKEILPVPWMKSLGVLWALSSQIDKDPIQVFLPPRGRDGQEKRVVSMKVHGREGHFCHNRRWKGRNFPSSY